MKIRLSLICMVAFLTSMNVADAQLLHHHAGRGFRGGQGLATGGESAFRQVSGEVQAGVPGRFWFEANVADRGLGYQGSYLTVGGKRRLFEDFLDGRWLFEAQLHHSIDEDQGDFFSNIGIERVFSIPAAGADISLGGWYDFNSETDTGFSNPFHQIGVSGAIKSRRWDLLANGYFPIGETDFTLGDPTGETPFARNFILSSPAIDAAQTGFDVTMRWRPKQLAFANGTVDFGGYGYKSDEIDFFGGGRVRLGVQVLRGATISAEVNHDERFNTTGVLSVGWTFGANGGVGGEYAGIGRDLEATQRNDHVVRVLTEASFVVNPNTGLPYNVLHVNNEGGEDGINGLGTFERPFLTLAEAEAAGSADDAIFVASGDGTPNGLETGLALQNRQLLLGDGGTYTIPNAATGGGFQLVTDGGIGPTIRNPLGTSVVELANGNRIAGVTIDGIGTNNGINGNSVNNLAMEDVNVVNAGLNGVRLDNFTGNLDIRDSNFSGNGASGLLVDNLTDNTATILLNNNIASTNGLDGFTFQRSDPASAFDPGSFILNANTTSNNFRHGLFVNNFANTSTNGLNILNHTADANVNTGIVVDTGTGKLNILAPNVTNNSVNGIRITDFTSGVGDTTVIAGAGNNSGLLDGNGLGGSNLLIELTQPNLVQNVLVTDIAITGSGGAGVAVSATGSDTELNFDLRDNVSITDNLGDGISLVSTFGSTINADIGNPDLTTAPLQITNNAFLSGAGISVLSQGLDGELDLTAVNANISNVAILNDENITITPDGVANLVGGTVGVDIDSIGSAIVDVVVADSSIGNPAETADQHVIDGVDILLDNDNSFNRKPNRVLLDNLDVVVGSSGDLLGNLGTGVIVTTLEDTLSDITISDSTFRPNSQPLEPLGPNDGVFGDTVGKSGIELTAIGAADFIDPVDPIVMGLGQGLAGPGTVAAANPVGMDVVSDGMHDNLTQLTLLNNTIRDFTFDGVDIAAFGDARLLLNISGNTVANNGAGQNTDADDDNVFGEEPLTPEEAAPNTTQLTFFDGINVDAFEASTISARIQGNSFQDNFERGLSLNTFDDATVNAIVSGNGFAGNDRGTDENIDSPLLSVGGPTPPVGGITGVLDFEAINNEEFYFRSFETPVFTLTEDEFMDSGNGDLFDPLGIDDDGNMGVILSDMGTPGVRIPGNGFNGAVDVDGNPIPAGMDILGNVIPIGQATINLAVLNNGFQNGTDIQDFSLDGLGLTLGDFGFADGLIDTEELLFLNRCIP